MIKNLSNFIKSVLHEDRLRPKNVALVTLVCPSVDGSKIEIDAAIEHSAQVYPESSIPDDMLERFPTTHGEQLAVCPTCGKSMFDHKVVAGMGILVCPGSLFFPAWVVKSGGVMKRVVMPTTSASAISVLLSVREDILRERESYLRHFSLGLLGAGVLSVIYRIASATGIPDWSTYWLSITLIVFVVVLYIRRYGRSA